MPHSEHEQTARRLLDAMVGADAGRLRELVEPDLVWEVPRGAVAPYGGVHRGAEAIIELMTSAVSGAFVPGSAGIEVRALLSDATRVMIEAELRARAPDGRSYENGYVFILEFRNGRVAEIREHVDTALAAQFFAAGA